MDFYVDWKFISENKVLLFLIGLDPPTRLDPLPPELLRATPDPLPSELLPTRVGRALPFGRLSPPMSTAACPVMPRPPARWLSLQPCASHHLDNAQRDKPVPTSMVSIPASPCLTTPTHLVCHAPTRACWPPSWCRLHPYEKPAPTAHFAPPRCTHIKGWLVQLVHPTTTIPFR
jgi:hypothetical protein